MVDESEQGRILIVDDERDIRALMGGIFEDSGFKVDFADGGRQALEKIKSFNPEVMTLDLTMPDMDGWAVLDRLGAEPNAPAVIILSGGGERARAGAISPHVVAYLPKPFRVDDLVGTCQRALAHRRKQVSVADERRHEPRRPLMIEASVLTRDGTPIAVGKLLDLSPGGAQLDLGAPFPPGETVRVAFNIPGQAPMSLEGRIQWRNSATVGLSFLNFPAGEQARLRKLLYPDDKK